MALMRPLQRVSPRLSSKFRLPRKCFTTARISSATNSNLSTSSSSPATFLSTDSFTQISALSNGVRVATEALPGPFSGVGIYIDAGSRYETPSLRGASHIIDRLAFKSTTTRTSDSMLETLESLGGNIHCASSRETLMYQAATFNSAVPTTLGLLAETIRDPLITAEEVDMQLETADYEIKEIWSKPELILPELVHMAGYKDNTLGNPLLCPEERLPYINRDTIMKYREAFLRPDRIVVAFAGVNHDDALRLTENWFGDMQGSTEAGARLNSVEGSEVPRSTYTGNPVSSSSTSASQLSSKLLSKVPFLKNLSTSAVNNASASLYQPCSLDGSFSETVSYNTPSHYTGGFLSLPPIPPPANPHLPRLSHIHVALEALPISSPDVYALATLQTLLGGGGSFSAGGPGKGMYSRLYTNVLNQFGWVENCVSLNHSYTDSGLFGISASCEPQRLLSMLEVICRELVNLSRTIGYGRLDQGEVTRAKNQLKSSLLMNLESRMVELEDLGRQVQVHGRKISVGEMCKSIDEVSIDDLRRVAGQIVGGNVQNRGGGTGRPTVVVQEGETEGVTLRPIDQGTIERTLANWKVGKMA